MNAEAETLTAISSLVAAIGTAVISPVLAYFILRNQKSMKKSMDGLLADKVTHAHEDGVRAGEHKGEVKRARENRKRATGRID
jgi:predicted PurR-regulated permease PerM